MEGRSLTALRVKHRASWLNEDHGITPSPTLTLYLMKMKLLSFSRSLGYLVAEPPLPPQFYALLCFVNTE